MIDFGGTIYYIDIAAFDKQVEPVGQKATDIVTETNVNTTKNQQGEITLTEEHKSSHLRGKELDPARFHILTNMLEIIIDYDDEIDTSLGVERAFDSTSFAFRLAFNTLYNYGIIKEKQ